ncbi:MAG: hypothetical protein ABIH66_00390 [bacterium]
MAEATPETSPKEVLKRLRRLKKLVANMGEALLKEGDVKKTTSRFRDVEEEFGKVRELLGEDESGAEALVALLEEDKRKKWLKEVEALGGEIEDGYRRMLEEVEENRGESLDRLGVIRKAKEVLDSFCGRKQNKEPRFFDRKG